MRLFVDTREGTLAEAGDPIRAIAAGRFAPDRVEGDLADLCTGRARGRQDGEETTPFEPVGTALDDLAAAALVALSA